jgi:probable rRNA maturation factor
VLRAVKLAAGVRKIHSLSIVLVSDDEMGVLHAQYMGDPSPTDVLTFDLRDDADAEALDGEVVVSVDTAAREARLRKLPEAQEGLRYIVHGVLHLVGYDDHTPRGRRAMRRREDEVLAELGLKGLGALKKTQRSAGKGPVSEAGGRPRRASSARRNQ